MESFKQEKDDMIRQPMSCSNAGKHVQPKPQFIFALRLGQFTDTGANKAGEGAHKKKTLSTSLNALHLHHIVFVMRHASNDLMHLASSYSIYSCCVMFCLVVS